MKLSDNELKQVLELVSPTGVDYGAGRICRMLAKGENITGTINAVCSVGNLSDTIRKSINPKIQSLGLFIACVKPPVSFVNKFDQTSFAHIYSFYKAHLNAPAPVDQAMIKPAANDHDTEQPTKKEIT